MDQYGQYNNSEFGTRNKTSNDHVMCFVIISMIIKNDIFNNYTRPMHNIDSWCFDAAPFVRRPWEPRRTV